MQLGWDAIVTPVQGRSNQGVFGSSIQRLQVRQHHHGERVGVRFQGRFVARIVEQPCRREWDSYLRAPKLNNFVACAERNLGKTDQASQPGKIQGEAVSRGASGE